MSQRRTPADRHRAAAALMTYGSSVKAAAACGVPSATIRYWQANDSEFRDMVRRAEAAFGEQMRADLAQIVEKASCVVLDRLKHGDVVTTATGEKVRVPIRGRDAAVVLGIAFDKLRITENKPTRIAESRPTIQEIADMLRGKQSLNAQ